MEEAIEIPVKNIVGAKSSRTTTQLPDGRLCIREVREAILPSKGTTVYEHGYDTDTFKMVVLEPLPNGTLRVEDLSQNGRVRVICSWTEDIVPGLAG